ncbi:MULTISPECIES: sulfotransferase family protein [unclassified Streptomyces]|uniref:sulfotransferase family protein n=1 Tax=unclassified Streptomyces TaxID=2593676 RepID=UPI00224F9B95|nr:MULTISPECIES: sulfotransferase family protein [unclassified Streptomyces]MCX5144113.1 sulfotransferase family protein [Streptomyces sp. NBC_00338]WRZ68490.1 sulfotransferase family protein [Streptomyces sp. NBC_01257]WSU62448.1 sulfotransferase family protein [Streptomyces sp. NBC_01104]
MTDQPSLLALWCVPRSRSTAFERAMYERGDFLVVHEPFSRVCDFGEAEVAGRTCTSQEQVMAALAETAADRPVFFKDTTDFRLDRLGASPDFLRRCRHAAMVRNPRDTVRSHLVMQSDATSPAMGFGHLWDIVSTVTSAGHPMHLVDGDRVAGDAEAEMRRYCTAMGIDFLAEALDFKKEPPASWKTTERWHAGASESNALGVAPAGRKQFPENLEQTALAFEQDQLPYYERITATLGGGGA